MTVNKHIPLKLEFVTLTETTRHILLESGTLVHNYCVGIRISSYRRFVKNLTMNYGIQLWSIVVSGIIRGKVDKEIFLRYILGVVTNFWKRNIGGDWADQFYKRS